MKTQVISRARTATSLAYLGWDIENRSFVTLLENESTAY